MKGFKDNTFIALYKLINSLKKKPNNNEVFK